MDLSQASALATSPTFAHACRTELKLTTFGSWPASRIA
eukprot:CAMPEP_0179282296 /NCGR_PEP_ID=MMETSP0797-20121207/37597_1 /TAXON_ID=47934 /ORGANISM="Dinophysis acuminata, Strain DAEP01" /LENGTH=37 /DNA_ID= /DNA_START= /DNA_END= /DNA_ORIENTATION=